MRAQRKTGDATQKLRIQLGQSTGGNAAGACVDRIALADRRSHFVCPRVEGREQRAIGIGSGYEKAASADRGGGEFATRGSSNSWEVN